MRHENEHQLKDLIGEYLKDNKIGRKLKEANLVQDWEKIMGSLINKHTQKITIAHQVLYIHVDVAPLKQELNYQRSRIKQLVNEYLGEEYIKEVVIR